MKKIIISCSGKFHNLLISQYLDENKILFKTFTGFTTIKNTRLARYVRRRDSERINTQKIYTFPLLIVASRIYKNDYLWNSIYDFFVSISLRRSQNFDVFIGWSGMSLMSMRAAKAQGAKVILERCSSHIVYQDRLLKEEYAMYQKNFSIDKRTISKELKEYDEADVICVPSEFVYNSFVEMGVEKSKLYKNPYPISSSFAMQVLDNRNNSNDEKFIILYLGALTVRKGLLYLFEALSGMDLDKNCYEVWFIGDVTADIKATVTNYDTSNWKFYGYKNHEEMKDLLRQCDIAVHPSVEEGLSYVLMQLMAYRIPIIATENTGASDIVKDGLNGFVIPARSEKAIREKIIILFNDRILLNQFKFHCSIDGFSLQEYGSRYVNLINSL
jgi:glycosyltransferase involved in cell wall biosynthesis